MYKNKYKWYDDSNDNNEHYANDGCWMLNVEWW